MYEYDTLPEDQLELFQCQYLEKAHPLNFSKLSHVKLEFLWHHDSYLLVNQL